MPQVETPAPAGPPTQEPADGNATEAARLRALYDYEILESPPDPRFDRIVQLASRLIGMPIALISLLDASRQWIKARHGVDLHEMPRATAFCAVTVGRDELTIVEDAVADERFSANPLVTGVPQLRFYAGAPLRTKEGHRLGTLCVMDTAPHVLSAAQGELLAELAAVAMDEVELHRAGKRMSQLATADSATDVLSRRTFFASARRETSRSRRYGSPLSVMVIDIDYLQRLNDHFGHATGDRALTALVHTIERGIREEAIVGRLHGASFMVLLPEASINVATQVAERLRLAATAIRIETPSGARTLTVSIGLTQIIASDPDFDTTLARAEAALLAAKEAGRDRVIVA